MSERCPLGNSIYWTHGTPFKIPEECREQCEEIWDEATNSGPGDIDNFAPNCEHDAEYDDTSLQRAKGNGRTVSILSVCMVEGIEAFSESWDFKCPYN